MLHFCQLFYGPEKPIIHRMQDLDMFVVVDGVAKAQFANGAWLELLNSATARSHVRS